MPVVRVGQIEIRWCVDVEPEGQEDLDVGTLAKDGRVYMSGILQLVHADGVVPLRVASCVQWV